ncbi:hypothetical protein HYFRA_00006551 [Hymenoscyphus fraxineus]|uniref:Uncharacterized protein n=1 Tax=Hymenoscyphus fraxineus TaxID=746836 RepID=A0A9N9PSQ4_9HELO|nr:hypothetical protein HYFRA_00006551 [Hymenoscyphus fraxineus]
MFPTLQYRIVAQLAGSMQLWAPGPPLSSDASPITVAIFWSEDLRRWSRQWSPALLPAAEQDQTASLDETRHQTKQASPSASNLWWRSNLSCLQPRKVIFKANANALLSATATATAYCRGAQTYRTVPNIHALWRCSGPLGESAAAAASKPKFEEDSHGHHTAAAAVIPVLGAFAPSLSPSLVAHAVATLKEGP